jgi:hypothetical protein
MTTYNTYQEAKIANTNCEIFTDGNIFVNEYSSSFYYDMKKCHPKDYCITLEKFLACGYKLVADDEWLDKDGDVMRVYDYSASGVNEPHEFDNERYILKAKVLEDEFNDSEIANGSGWDGTGLPPVGVECEKIFDGKGETITPLYYDDKFGMVMFYYRSADGGMHNKYDWCLVKNCIFLKPKTARELFIEKVCGKIKTSAQENIDIIGKMFDIGCEFKEREGE